MIPVIRITEPLKILVLGSNGQLGWELRRTLAPLGRVIAFDRSECDLASADSIRRVLREIRPNLVANAAAYTAVDNAETDIERAMQINAAGSGWLAEEAKRLGAALVTYSTDYVFDGAKTSPYTEEDAPNPLNVYGRSKLAGDQAVCAVGGSHLIFRTSWVYGARGRNFLATILRLAQERQELKIVDDQTGAPTCSRAIAEATAQVLAQALSRAAPPAACSTAELVAGISGVYNLSTSGQTTWFGFAREILCYRRPGEPHRQPHLIPISSQGYGAPAVRPANSVLSNAKLQQAFAIELPDWQTMLALVMEELGFVRVDRSSASAGLV